MNKAHQILKERMNCGMLKKSKIFDLPNDSAFVVGKDDVTIGFEWGVTDVAKISILKIAEKIKNEI